ncbi:putative methyltransferase NSUN7 [Chanos chanos]|uniref:Methyltransferase NSUN7 n=1 Tax=Chanos chanos TaxID=29144 RepID=A0A6J2UQ89_CHACN|nr:putative methyltransferase NSUN7 [Chanos chanos]
MVKQGADQSHRSSSKVNKRRSQLSSFKDLTLLHKAPPDNGADKPSNQPSLLLSEPVDIPQGIPDRVYLKAAEIFQSTHVEKPAAQRLINYGKKRTKMTMPEAKDETSQRQAYELAFNALKYQELLEDILIDSCFYLSQPVADDMMSLVAVMLYDFQERKFLPREQLANQGEEVVQEVREVEECLLRFKTKLAASLARCRIKHDLQTIDCILPDSVRMKQQRASCLPVHAWINTLKTSVEEVCGVLKREGFSQVNSVGQLEGQSFCEDPHCSELLVFPAQCKADLFRTRLINQHKLIIQDKSCCVGPWALRPLLVKDGDVLMVGFFSALTIAHVAAVIHTHSAPQTHTYGSASSPAHVFVCVGDGRPAQRERLQEALTNLGCNKNVKLITDCFGSLDVCDPRLQKVRLILLMPQCSVSAVCNPVEYILQENGDTDLLKDLSQGSVAQPKLNSLVSQQCRDLEHALIFPKVQAVVYSTCSSYPEENEEVVKRALAQGVDDSSKLQPYRLSSLNVLQSAVCEERGVERSPGLFKLEPSEQSNGCFLALLTREPNPEVVETPQEILARAAAKGLLDGIQPNQPIKKEGRDQKSHKAALNQGRNAPAGSHASLSSQLCVKEFQKREMKGSSSAPTVGQETKRKLSSRGKAVPSRHVPQKTNPPSTGSVSKSLTSTFSLHKSLARIINTAASANEQAPPVPMTTPPAPRKGRQQVLHPVSVTLPPVQFPDFIPPQQRKMHIPPPSTGPNQVLSYVQLKCSPHTSHTQSSSSLGAERNRVKHTRPWL